MYSARGAQSGHLVEAACTTAKNRVILIRDSSVAEGMNLRSSNLEEIPDQAVTRLLTEGHANRRPLCTAATMLGLTALAVG